MNLVIREFFRGLRERDELDAFIPELLTAMGYEVLSRPMTGTRQYGSDVAAIGIDSDGARKLFLFSIKRGDLSRQDWDGASAQALRPSLNEIKDVYLRSVAPEHKDLPVVICPTVGGVVPESVLPLVNGYMNDASTDQIHFRLWTGDTLSAKLIEGALREEVFPADLRNHLRKAAALVGEPTTALAHFNELVDRVVEENQTAAVVRARVLYISLWIFLVWGREEGNLDAPYQASEIVVLRSWALLHELVANDRSRKQEASHLLFEVIRLHQSVWNDLYRNKILPHAGSDHALSLAVRSRRALDVNLAMFETLGRIALGGLWQLWSEAPTGEMPGVIEAPSEQLTAIAEGLVDLINSNPTLATPLKEDQGIDIALALLLLLAVPATRVRAHDWVRATANRIAVCYAVGSYYPSTTRDYSDLLSGAKGEKFEERTAGSIIQPILALAAFAMSDSMLVKEISDLQAERLQHCNFQTWVPNARSEAAIWLGDAWQGSSLGNLIVSEDGKQLWQALNREAHENETFAGLSAIALDHWPLLVTACRSVRLPVPPQLWIKLVNDLRALTEVENAVEGKEV